MSRRMIRIPLVSLLAVTAGTFAAGCSTEHGDASLTRSAPVQTNDPWPWIEDLKRYDDEGRLRIDALALRVGEAHDPSGAIKRGYELTKDTHLKLPDHVGNGLSCSNCHTDGGRTPKAAPFVGVTHRYPRYRARSGKEDNLKARINGCFERSMDGKALAHDAAPMEDLVAYMTWLSRDVAPDDKVAGVGMPRINPPAEASASRGKEVYVAQCIACHQADGKGLYTPDGKATFPALAGPHSFNVGAGMARLHTAAAFVKWNMPQGRGGTLTDQEAYDVAAYFTRFERPDFQNKAQDWPKGNKPDDARY